MIEAEHMQQVLSIFFSGMAFMALIYAVIGLWKLYKISPRRCKKYSMLCCEVHSTFNYKGYCIDCPLAKDVPYE